MKKIILIIVIILALLVGALFAIPIFFKDTLLQATKTTINKQVNADVEFANFKLSLFKSFPKATLELKEVVITGKEEFKNDTLLNIPFVRTKMSLTSLFGKSGMRIEEINLVKPQIKLVVNDEGKANWDLSTSETLASNQENTESKEGASDEGFKLQLEKIEIKDALMVYDDRSADMLLELSNINFDVKGKMYGTSTELQTNGIIESVNLVYGGATYINKTALETRTLVNVDYEKTDISISESELLVNRLPLELTGMIQIPSDSMFFNLALKTKVSDFESFLALVPPDYEDYLKEITTQGNATLSATVKGLFFDEIYPAFSIKMNIDDGNFKYADLPEEIKNIKADIAITKPQGVLDLMEVNIKEAHAEVKNNPVDLTLVINHPMTDPYFDGAFIGKINFDHIKDALPLDSVNVSGLVDANLFVKGNYSAIEKEEYERLKSDGIVLLDDFMYDSPDLTQKVFVPKGQLVFSPKNVILQEFNLKVGQSDFNLQGNISNYLNYVLKDGTLKGNLQLNSNTVNLNEILRLQVVEEAAENANASGASENTKGEETGEVLAFDIPKNIDITFRSKIKNAVIDRLPISDIDGLITAKKGRLMLNGLNMKMLDGELNLNGSYENTAQNQPLFDFGFDVISFDIPMAYRSLTGIQQMLPVAGKSQGRFSTNFRMNGKLSQDLKLITSSIDGTGLFNTNNLQIIDSEIFDQLKGILKAEKLKNVTVDDFKANFVVEDGNLLLKPFSTKVAGQEATVMGSLNAQSLLDMRLDFKIQRDAFGADIQNILSALPGNQKITIVPAGVVIKGPVGGPEVKMDLSETRKTITDATKGELQNSLNKLGKGLKKLFEK